jgi:hypothetical protein
LYIATNNLCQFLSYFKACIECLLRVVFALSAQFHDREVSALNGQSLVLLRPQISDYVSNATVVVVAKLPFIER